MIGALFPYRAYAIGAAIVASAYSGWKVRDWQCDAAMAKAERAAAVNADKMRDNIASSSFAYEELASEIASRHTDGFNTIREIYRDVKVPSDCALPDSAVGLLNSRIGIANAAASGKPSAAMP